MDSIKHCVRGYKATCGLDTLPWIIKLTSLEIIEISTQIYVLFVYNGRNIFSSNVHLATKPNYIIGYAIIITTNCVFCALSWFFYTFYHRSCYGEKFFQILWLFDRVFETIYVLFPVVFVLNDFNINDDSILKASAILNRENDILFIQVLIPSIALCISMITGPNDLIANAKRRWLNIKENNDQTTQNDEFKKYVNEKDCISLLCNTDKIKFIRRRTPGISDGNEELYNRYKRQQILRKVSLSIFVIFILGSGIGLLVFVLNHFTTSQELCSNYVYNNDINKHNEMRIWNEYCEYKVYPFTINNNELPCQCRVLLIRDNDMSLLLQKYDSNIVQNIVIDILTHFTMMETIKIESPVNFIPPIKLTNGMFNSEFMRVIDIEGIGIEYIEKNIYKWKLLQYLTIKNTLFDAINLDIISDELYQLNNIKYLHLEQFNAGKMEYICSMTQLKYLIFPYNAIESLPNCLLNKDLNEIKIINLDYVNGVRNDTLNGLDGISNLLSLPNLEQFTAYSSFITIFNFGRESFKFNVNVTYRFDDTRYLCGYYQWFPLQYIYFIHTTCYIVIYILFYIPHIRRTKKPICIKSISNEFIILRYTHCFIVNIIWMIYLPILIKPIILIQFKWKLIFRTVDNISI